MKQENEANLCNTLHSLLETPLKVLRIPFWGLEHLDTLCGVG